MTKIKTQKYDAKIKPRSQVKQKRAEFLRALHKLKGPELNNVIPYLNANGTKSIYECVHNVLHNPKIQQKAKLRKLLSPHKADIRYLADPRHSDTGKRQKLAKVGGFLPAILGAALPVLIDVVSKLVKG